MEAGRSVVHDRKQQCWQLGILFILVTSLLQPTVSSASGFRITNQSLEAVGLAGAHVAFTPGPDASYYNPANMAFLPDQWQVETSLTLLGLPSIEYRDRRSPLLDSSSESELFYQPLLHAVSQRYGKLRYGFSLTYPFGLYKQWEQPFPQATAEEFSLFVVEGNPTFSYEISEKFSLAGGIRILYGKGEVNSTVVNPPFSALSPLTALSRSSDGTDTQLGYNLAFTTRLLPSWTVAATYRSEVDLTLEGDSELRALAGNFPAASYAGTGSLDMSLPAVFSLATAYTYDKFTLELGWDRTFWSSFESLDFRYDTSLLGTVFDGFDRAIAKDWSDSDSYRIGITYDWNANWTSTLGFSYEKTPVPQATLGFELPDADALVSSVGLRYRCTANMTLGLSYMYHHVKSRTVLNAGTAGLPGIDGTFSDGGAHAINVGLIASF